MISIGCLIYRSINYATFVYDSVHKYTPMLKSKDAEFYFVANDPPPWLQAELFERKYRFHTHFPPERERRQPGISQPDYMAHVYSGCNRVFGEASGDMCCLISSDMAFSPGWLEQLLKEQDGNRIVTSQLIEPSSRANQWAGSHVGEFGEDISEFDEAAFLRRAAAVRAPGTRPGGQFVPALIPMALWHKNGGYPEGNIDDGSEFGIPGDLAMHRRWAALGAEHVTALSSVVYHFGSGEMRE